MMEDVESETEPVENIIEGVKETEKMSESVMDAVKNERE